MKTAAKKLYEAMFLIDSSKAASDWDGVETGIKNILKRVEAEIVSIKKWDERRLAYEIEGHSRGTYILCYFRADGKKVPVIERAVQLSEQIMRVLILCAEGREKRYIEKDIPAMPAEKNEQETAQAEQTSAQVPEPVAADVESSEQPATAESDSEQVDVDKEEEGDSSSVINDVWEPHKETDAEEVS
mgnify:CR=1 FL=1